MLCYMDDILEEEKTPRQIAMEEWIDMPEYVQEKQKPHAQIIVRFRNEEDLKKFAGLVEQNLTNKTKSIWYPELIRGIHTEKRYVDES